MSTKEKLDKLVKDKRISRSLANNLLEYGKAAAYLERYEHTYTKMYKSWGGVDKKLFE